jgi:glutamyl-tRNA synthetase
MQDTT